MNREDVRALLETVRTGLERLVDELERADRLLERGEDRAAVRGAVGGGLEVASGLGRAIDLVLEVPSGAFDEAGPGAEPSSPTLEVLVASRAAAEGWEVDSEIELAAESLSREQRVVVSEALGAALEYFSQVGGVDGIAVEVHTAGEGVEATVAESGGASGPPVLESSTAALRDLRQTVGRAGGEVELVTTWAEGTRLEITLDAGRETE